MRKIHALLAIQQQLFRELLGAILADHSEVHVLGNAENELTIAKSLSAFLDSDEFGIDDAVIVITSIEATDDVPAFVSRLLCEFPEVTIIGICSTTACIRSFQLQIDVKDVPCSLAGLIDALRECLRESLPW